MGFRRKLRWLILVLMPLFFFAGCGDLEPDMQDTRTVILNMDFHGKSSSRSSSSVSASELSQYNTHLILALPSGEVLTSNYRNFHSSFAQGLMNTADKKVSLEIPLNTQMKIFTFLFQENYSMSELFPGTRTVGYYGKSRIFKIDTQTNNLSLGVTLIQVPGTGTHDTTAPTASVIAATITTSGNAVVQSTETGTAYLVKTTVSVSDVITNNTVPPDSQWNSVTISSANFNTNLPATGLENGTYKVYAVDTAGNLSSASSNSVTVDTTAPTVSLVTTTADNQSSVSITDNITVTFSEAMEPSYITTSTSSGGYCAGNILVSSDNFSSCVQMSSAPASSSDNMTFTLDPYDNLTGGTTYKTRVTTGVKDTAGNALSSQYETSSGFTTLLPAPDNLSASGANNTIILTWNSVSGATSYTLYWDNVSGIDSSDTAITSITNDNYTDSNKETNYALDFDGSNDYVAADGVTSNLDSSTGLPFTVSAWAYPDTTTRGAIWAFNKTGNSTENLNLLFYGISSNSKKFTHHGVASKIGESTNTFEPGQWHHIVVVVESGNGKMFVNGGLEDEWPSGTNTSADRFSIGQEWDGDGDIASDYFNGKIDEVAVWNVVLSAADVTALYNSGNGLKASANSGNYDNSADLIGYWKFNEGTGSTLTDNTSNSNNGTLTNMDSSDWVNGMWMDIRSIYYYKVAAVNSSGTGPLSSVASAILDQRIQVSETFNGHTYALTSAAMTWAQGKVIATALGGYLTTINTKAENDWLTTELYISPDGTWMGANDIATENTWVWDNGTTSGDNGLTDDLCGTATNCRDSNAKWADNTDKWYGANPNDYSNNQDCGRIWKNTGHWDDDGCDNSRYGIIEFDL